MLNQITVDSTDSIKYIFGTNNKRRRFLLPFIIVSIYFYLSIYLSIYLLLSTTSYPVSELNSNALNPVKMQFTKLNHRKI